MTHRQALALRQARANLKRKAEHARSQEIAMAALRRHKAQQLMAFRSTGLIYW